MRAYFFGNMYLSSIQQGIQAAHVVHELFLKYPRSAENIQTHHLYGWAENHKTMILLNGGYAEALEDLHAFFESPSNPYPFTWFHEEKASLNGALTSVGIVLPEKIYDTARLLREESRMGSRELEDVIRSHGGYQHPIDDGKFETRSISNWELGLCLELNRYGLAS